MVHQVGTYEYLHLTIDKESGVGTLQFARPAKSNAVSLQMLQELKSALQACEANGLVRCLVLSGQGKNFCAGLDLQALGSIVALQSDPTACPATIRDTLRRSIIEMQDAVSALERFRWPIVACVHGACVGAGVDIISACDIRVCTRDAKFCVKEVDLAITADLGTLQRLPYVVGEARTRELALTARTFSAADALDYGLVTSVDERIEDARSSAMKLARSIAGKPSLAIVGTKQVLLETRDKSVAEGLAYVAMWNSAQLLSTELINAFERASTSQQRARRSHAAVKSKL